MKLNDKTKANIAKVVGISVEEIQKLSISELNKVIKKRIKELEKEIL